MQQYKSMLNTLAHVNINIFLEYVLDEYILLAQVWLPS